MEDEEDVTMSGLAEEGTGGRGFGGVDDGSDQEGGHDYGEDEGTHNYTVVTFGRLYIAQIQNAVVCCAQHLLLLCTVSPVMPLQRLSFLAAQSSRRRSSIQYWDVETATGVNC